jgi:hypothetical protein
LLTPLQALSLEEDVQLPRMIARLTPKDLLVVHPGPPG